MKRRSQHKPTGQSLWRVPLSARSELHPNPLAEQAQACGRLTKADRPGGPDGTYRDHWWSQLGKTFSHVFLCTGGHANLFCIVQRRKKNLQLCVILALGTTLIFSASQKKPSNYRSAGFPRTRTCLGCFCTVLLCCLITCATHSHPFRAPVYCGCQPGPTGVLIHPGKAVDQQCANPLAAALLLHCTELYTCVRVRPEHAATNRPLGRMHVS